MDFKICVKNPFLGVFFGKGGAQDAIGGISASTQFFGENTPFGRLIIWKKDWGYSASRFAKWTLSLTDGGFSPI